MMLLYYRLRIPFSGGTIVTVDGRDVERFDALRQRYEEEYLREEEETNFEALDRMLNELKGFDRPYRGE